MAGQRESQAGTGGEGGVCPECRLIQSHGNEGFFISEPKYYQTCNISELLDRNICTMAKVQLFTTIVLSYCINIDPYSTSQFCHRKN